MRFLLVAFLLSSLALAQTAPQPQTATAPQAPAAAAPKPAEVSGSSAVITVSGFCPGTQATGADCKTEVSRAEFEKLANAVNAPEARRLELANAYARFLVLSKLAEERGIDKKPEVQEVLRLSRMQALSQLLEKDIRDEAANIPAADMDKYYAEHTGQFEQATMQRVFIPKMPPNPTEKVDEAAVKAEGVKIAASAKAPNADFTKLQKQAYDDLKITATPPPTDLKDVRRDNLPAAQAKAFDVKPGEVSDPIDDTGGIYIYKVVSKKSLTRAEVEQDIRKALEQERGSAAMQKLVGNVKLDYNQAYFGPPAERPGPPSLQPPQPAPKAAAPATKAPSTAPKSATPPKTPK
jgi:hypothetical protein